MTDTVLERVRKLLTKAEDPACTPQEARALNDKAAQLIAKYGVDRALLASTRPDSDVVGDRLVVVPAPYALDKSGLLATVAAALRCRCVRLKRWTGSGYAYHMHLFGFDSDLERVELLYTSLLVQASYGLAGELVPAWESPAAFRRSWLVGFTRAVGQRLREAEQQAEASARGAEPAAGGPLAVVLADRKRVVDRRVAEIYPNLTTSGPRRLMGSGHDGGYRAGRRADLGGTRVARASVRQLTRQNNSEGRGSGPPAG